MKKIKTLFSPSMTNILRLVFVYLLCTLNISMLQAEYRTLVLNNNEGIFYYSSNGSTFSDEETITMELGGEYPNPNPWGNSLLQINRTGEDTGQSKSTTAWIKFASATGTKIRSLSMEIVQNGKVYGWLSPKNSFPSYTIIGDADTEDSYTFTEAYETRKSSLNGLYSTIQYNAVLGYCTYLGAKKFGYARINNGTTFEVSIPEVVRGASQSAIVLDQITGANLGSQIATDRKRSSVVQFYVNDPIAGEEGNETENIKDYFEVKWTNSHQGWSIDDNATWEIGEKGDDGYYLVTIPIQYTPKKDAADNWILGTFNTTITLSSINTIKTRTAEQHVTITVGDFWPISWGQGWSEEIEQTVYVGQELMPSDYLVKPQGVNMVMGKINITYIEDENGTGIVVDATTGKLTMVNECKAIVTYTQPANSEYLASELSITLNVKKRKPTFTLQSEKVLADDTHVFYRNREYVPFLISAMETNDEIIPHHDEPISITPTLDADLDADAIVFDGFNATTFNKDLVSTEITISQEETDQWYAISKKYNIQVVQNPIHVGDPICSRDHAEQFQDKDFVVTLNSNYAEYDNQRIRLGHTAGGTNGGEVIFHFMGIPDQLEISYERSNNYPSWNFYECATRDGVYTELQTTVSSGTATATFLPSSQYLKVVMTGSQTVGYITDICITEKIDITASPDPLTMYINGTSVVPASFFSAITNLTTATVTVADEGKTNFAVSVDGGEPASSLTLTRDHGLGYDETVTIPITVHYIGPSEDLQSEKPSTTITITNGDYTASISVVISGEIATNDYGVPAVIDPTIAPNTGIYTGTEHNGETHPKDNEFPFKTKRQVDVSAAFSSGVPIFDKLYIFGLTTNANGTLENNSYHQITAPTTKDDVTTVTPCYIYTKGTEENAGKYVFESCIPNMNVKTKPISTITASGQKLYFTGYCPYASCGGTTAELGVIDVQGGENATIDLYLDDLQLFARTKYDSSDDNTTGKSLSTMTIGEADLVGSLFTGITFYAQGSGAVFLFRSTSKTSSTPFKPSIHVRNNNYINGTRGSNIYVDALGKTMSAGQYSSPLQIWCNDAAQATTLTIDDIWPMKYEQGTENTNGLFKISTVSSSHPSIDLGNANTILNINGGQIELQNAYPQSKEYISTMAISYRTKTMLDMATFYGIGDDQVGGTIHINDGTITCAPLPDSKWNDEDWQSTYGGYYQDQYSMKCPNNTYLNGGTYNSTILACADGLSKGGSPTNKFGHALCKVMVPIAGVDEKGIAQLSPTWMDEPDIDGNFIRFNKRPISEYYTNRSATYGTSSITPTTVTLTDENGNDLGEIEVVGLLLPSSTVCFADIINIPWVVCAPEFTVTAAAIEKVLGGSQIVSVDPEYQTSKMVYAEIDGYIYELITSEDDPYTAPEMEFTLEIPEGNYYNDIDNETEYTIADKIYLLKPIYSVDEPYLFVPPFDVANVYVIESYPENRLVEDYNLNSTDPKIDDALYEQARRLMDLLYYWSYDVIVMENANDFWASNAYKDKWIRYETTNRPEGKTGSYAPNITQLYHFDGTNWDANYILHESTGTWGFDGEKFTTDWEIVNEQSTPRGTGDPNVIMEKGHFYSMNFPSTFGEKEDGLWDYWSGKFLLYEGYGPQTLSGKDVHASKQVAYDTPASAQLRGNETFASMTVAGMTNAYYITIPSTNFIKSEDAQTIESTSGFLLANALASSSLPQRIKSIDFESGVITYEDGEDGNQGTTTGVPTISGDREMVVYSVHGGIGIIPIKAQEISIYNASGQLITSQYISEETQIPLASGIYLICGENERAKAVVR